MVETEHPLYDEDVIVRISLEHQATGHTVAVEAESLPGETVESAINRAQAQAMDQMLEELEARSV